MPQNKKKLKSFRPKDERLVKRFYEPLVLLSVLSPAQGDRIALEAVPNNDSDFPNALNERRRILNHLATLCDYQKGGTTVTALALEQKPQGPTYWFSSPRNTEKKIRPFLESTLETLAMIASEPAGSLYKTWQMLQKAVNKEMERTVVHDKDERTFLTLCQKPIQDEQSLLEFCAWAYSTRKSRFIKAVSTGSVNSEAALNVRHYLGRMSSVFKAAKQLSELAPKHVGLFENFELTSVPCGGPVEAPSIDGQLTLDGIARRMTREENDYEALKGALGRLDDTAKIMQNIRDCYEDPNFTPSVHAEAALRDALYRSEVQFYEGDRYIACSKPACFCCYHYARNHPGGFVDPPSSNNLWINWRVPDLPDEDDATAVKEQNKIMNAMIADIRVKCIERVLKSSGLSNGRRRPDSTTGFTASASVGIALPDEHTYTEESIDAALQRLNFESHLDTEADGGVSLEDQPVKIML